MASTSEFFDVKDAKTVVVRTLKEYGSIGYSRLLMSTGLPEDVLKKSLDLLIKDKVIKRLLTEGDPEYRLTPGGINFWPFS
jgi:hypothetical protein